MFGAYIIRQPKENEHHGLLYDHDLPQHTMVIMDWIREMSSDKFINHHHSDGDANPDSILINGLGSSTGKQFQVPLQRYEVEKVSEVYFLVIKLKSSQRRSKILLFGGSTKVLKVILTTMTFAAKKHVGRTIDDGTIVESDQTSLVGSIVLKD